MEEIKKVFITYLPDLGGALIITAVLAAALLIGKFTKKKLSPILLIVLAAVAGMVVYAV